MLHNGETFWDKINPKSKGYPPAEGLLSCDVLVAGGGMSGMLTARTLAKNGSDCIVIEAEKTGGGSSLANTGLFQWANDLRLIEAIDRLGPQRGELFYQASYEGIERLKSIARELSGLKHFRPTLSILRARNKREAELLAEEYQALRSRSYPVDYLDADELEARYGIKGAAALITKGDVAADPCELISALVRDAKENYGLRIFEQTSISRVIESDRLLAVIDEQTAIECDHIVYTTGYTENRFTDNLGSYADLVRSFALVTKPVSPDKEMPTDAMIWDAKRPYLYVRTCPGRRMLIGGLDEDQKEIPSEARMKKRAEELIDELNKLFPGYDFETEFIWGARFGESGDGLPFIGKIPGEKNRYLLLGYGGNGTVYSSIGSSVIMNCIEGREDIYASLFDPGRVVQEKII